MEGSLFGLGSAKVRLMRTFLPLVFLLTLGCKAPEPAPTELDELAHFFLAQVHQQEHERILEGAANVLDWYGASGLAGGGPTGGSLTDLTQAEVDAFEGMGWSPDPEPCAGVYAISELSCDLSSAADIALEPNQTEVFEGNYAAYDRTWDTDPGCYTEGSCDAVDWTSIIEDNFVFNYDMSYEMVVKLRRSRDEAEQPSVVLIRSVMPDKAMEDVDAGDFEQSYHIEAYIKRDQGLLHLYGLWNYGWIMGSDPDSDFWADQYYKGLLDFEDSLEDLCVNGW